MHWLRCQKWGNQPEPSLIDRREQVLDPMTAYQITSIMEGVVLRGTAAGAGFQKEVGKPVAGKTGTTNDEKDAWFIGYTPDIVVGVYMGYDKPRHLGRGATGGHLSAPIVKDFLKVALADKPAVRDWSGLADAGLDDALNQFAWDLGGSDDIHATATFRRQLIRRLGRRAIMEAIECRN